MKRLALLLALTSGFLMACGDDDNSGTPDARPNIDARPSIDARPQIDSAPAACTATASYGDVGTKTDGATVDSTTTPGEYFVQTDLNADPDRIALDLWKGYGALTDFTPGTYTITGAETAMDSCGICVYILTEAFDPAPAELDAYMATGGTVNITSFTPNLQATLTNITLQHVTITKADGTTTPVGDGCNSGVTNLVFNSPVTGP